MPKWHRNKRTTRDQNTCLGFPNISGGFFSVFLLFCYCRILPVAWYTVACYGSPQILLMAWYICMLRITADTASGLTHLYVTAHRRCCWWLDTFVCYRSLWILPVAWHFCMFRSSWILLEAWHICVLQISLNTTGGLAHTHHSCCDQLTSSLCSWAVAMLVIS